MFTLTYTPKHVFSYIELTAVYTVYRYTINNVNRYYNVYTAFFDCRIQAVYNRIDKINRNRKNCKTVNNIYILLLLFYLYTACYGLYTVLHICRIQLNLRIYVLITVLYTAYTATCIYLWLTRKRTERESTLVQPG